MIRRPPRSTLFPYTTLVRSKAALDQLTAVLAAEHLTLRVYAVDPGDMATDMHRAADPDATGLPEPAAVVPALLRPVEGELPAGRYRVAFPQGPATSSRVEGGGEVLLVHSGRHRGADPPAVAGRLPHS